MRLVPQEVSGCSCLFDGGSCDHKLTVYVSEKDLAADVPFQHVDLASFRLEFFEKVCVGDGCRRYLIASAGVPSRELEP